MTKPTPKLLYDMMRPKLDEITRLIGSAPLPKEEEIGLAMLVTTYFVGVVSAVADKHPLFDADEVLKMISLALAMERDQLINKPEPRVKH